MSWKKVLFGVMGRREASASTDGTETDDEITDSEETVSTDKRFYLFGMPFYKLSYKRLPWKCVKISFLTVNALMFFVGISTVITSTLMFIDNKMMSQLIGQRIFLILLLLTGAFVCCVSLVGIIGFTKRRKKFLNIYVLCYCLFLCTIFVSAILSFWIFESITRNVQNDMADSIVKYRSLHSTREAWDNTHRYLHCCGIRSAKDWGKHRMNIPSSCCSTTIDQCSHMAENVAYKSGCLKNAVRLLKSYIDTMIISTLGISVISLLSLFLALGARNGIKRRPSNTS